MLARADAQRTARGPRPRPRVALVDPLPDVLRLPSDPAPAADRIATRPAAYTGDRSPVVAPELPVDRPLVLVTGGTSVREPDLLGGLAAAVAKEGFEVVVTVTPGTLPGAAGVHEIGFVPLARLLPGLDTVVCTAGMGTVQAALAALASLLVKAGLSTQA